MHQDVIQVLHGLQAHGLRPGVCTNKAPTERLFAALGLDRFFQVIAGGAAVPAKKPDAGHLRAPLEQLGVPSARSVLVSFGYTPLPARCVGRSGDRPFRRPAGGTREARRSGGLKPLETCTSTRCLDTGQGGLLIAAWGRNGRLAQRESTRFTREGSLVQSQHRPPRRAGTVKIPMPGQRFCALTETRLLLLSRATPNRNPAEAPRTFMERS